MSIIIDRRENDKKKQLTNRGRFLERSKEAIKKAMRNAIGSRSLTDLGSGGNVTIPAKGTKEPTFRNGSGGRKDIVVPGNRGSIRGDKMRRPQNGNGSSGSGPGSGGDDESMDDFEFTLTREEFLNFFFEDLELPDLVKTALKDMTDTKWCRHGFTTVGVPANLDIGRSFVNSLARKIALQSAYEKKIKEAKLIEPVDNAVIDSLERKKKTIPFLDDVDLRYRLFVQEPRPVTKAVMFCLMDVSGSMGEYEKDLAKRFFMLLYMFLNRKYERVDVVFVRHTTNAKEVDEEEFFYGLESGGTIVSSALDLTQKIIKERYNRSDWNIYVSQCSDGDNSAYDNDECRKIIREQIMPLVQYFAYVQIGHQRNESMNFWGQYAGGQDWSLMETYKSIAKDFQNFQIRRLDEPKDIYPVFRDLFKKDIKK